MVGLVACGGDDASAPDEPVIATTSIWADITGAVACDESIRSIIPPGADPHTFEPSLRDRELVEHTSTIISNGLGLEQSLADLLDTARDHGVDVIEMATDIDVIPGDEEHDGHDDDHLHGAEGDPHVWQDPLRVAGTLDTIASALAGHDLATCADEYRAELLALDDDITATLAVVPDTSRVLVTSHDSLEYFADRYGFEIIGTVIASTNTLAETNAADLATLADVIEQYNVPAIFTEELESTADADALAARLGVEVVPLVTDSLTDDPDTDTYLEMMRHNAAAIAAALEP
jgi:zinc/manganese transport system substrate-binding protein